MIHFRKIWDKQKQDFLMEHKEDPIKECYRLFLQTFPEAHDVTETAFRNERSRIGAISEKYKTQNKNHSSRTPKPLFSEHTKKGYVKIKIEQPNKWMFKHHYVWWQKTGHKPDSKKEIVIFLDGNNRNFNFENLFIMPKKCIAIFNNKNISSGTIPGNPQATKINAMNAILIHKIFNAGRKTGLVSESTGRFKTDTNEYQKNRMRNLTPKQKEIEKERRQKYWQKIKSDPQRHEELKAKRREMYKKWKQKKQMI